MNITPLKAAKLAENIYDVQNPRFLKAFIKRNELLESESSSSKLHGEVGTRMFSSRDGFGLCALDANEKSGKAYIIFRGTTTSNYGADFFTDARIGVELSHSGLPVHIGFNHVFTSMVSDIKKFIDGNKDKITSIHCVGHSLGGAVATLCAAWVRSSYTSCSVSLYTFGSPKVGFEWFSKRATNNVKLGGGNIFRVYHATDPVPMVPVFPYVHTPWGENGVFLRSSEMAVSGKAHKMAKYVGNCEGKSWENLSDPAPLTAKETMVRKWIESDRSVNPFDPRTWEWINAGLAYVVGKILGAGVSVLQAPFIAGLTIADKLAYILKKGIDLSKQISSWVFGLIKKIARAIGMKIVKSVEELTRAFIRRVLAVLIVKMSEGVRNAIQKLDK
jgi:hypothetical protein